MMGLPPRKEPWFPKLATDADLNRPDRRLSLTTPQTVCSCGAKLTERRELAMQLCGECEVDRDPRCYGEGE